MARQKCEIRIGTSGWHYNHWQRRFYPEQLRKHEWFEYYAKSFDTVEINNTFYQLPKEASLQRWYDLAPANFVYSVKANRFITHIKRLKDAADSLEQFSQRISILGEKLGPVLYQLPPNLRKDLGLLRAFLQLIAKQKPAVFEFRHESWFSQDCYQLLEQFGKNFCIHDLPGAGAPQVITGGLIYIRFHGPGARYAGKYSKTALAGWAKWIKEHLASVQAVYAYFNNDVDANAVYNAKELRDNLD